MKYYTTNNDSYTNEHNLIMDELIYSCCIHNNPGSRYKIAYDWDKHGYYPLNKDGAKMLEHLLNCDLISVVADQPPLTFWPGPNFLTIQTIKEKFRLDTSEKICYNYFRS